MKSLLEEFADSNFLITTNQWFTAPDGKMYRTVWGKVEIYNSEKTLGIKTNLKSTNWYAIVGTGTKRLIIAGCQIHYACICNDSPNIEQVDEQKWVESKGEFISTKRDTIIYLTQ